MSKKTSKKAEKAVKPSPPLKGKGKKAPKAEKK
jgi:hypothetical protein